MREIKFRAWHKTEKSMLQADDDYGTKHSLDCVVYFMQGQPVELMQFTGLKDKNGLIYIYEGDIIGVDGTVRGNRYENTSLLQDSTNLIIEGFGTKNWWTTYKEAVARGCKDTE